MIDAKLFLTTQDLIDSERSNVSALRDAVHSMGEGSYPNKFKAYFALCTEKIRQELKTMPLIFTTLDIDEQLLIKQGFISNRSFIRQASAASRGLILAATKEQHSRKVWTNTCHPDYVSPPR